MEGYGEYEPGGDIERLDDTPTADECAELVRRTEPNANGATYYAKGLGNSSCYALFRGTGTDGDVEYQTCLFKGQLGLYPR